jgi:hypothetical protein
MVIKMSVDSSSKRMSVRRITVKSGALGIPVSLSLPLSLDSDFGVCVAKSVYAGVVLESLREQRHGLDAHKDIFSLLVEMCKHRVGSVPDVYAIRIRINELFKVYRESLGVTLEANSVGLHPFRDVKYDASEAVLVDPDLLIVGDLAQFAAQRLG